MINTFLIGLLMVGGFVIWKFGIQPRMNEGEPIEPPDDYKTFGEKLEESMGLDQDLDINTKVDF